MHLYPDFLKFQEEHDIPTIQMDCVEGRNTDAEALLTLHFVPFHTQLAYILSEHNSIHVVSLLDALENALEAAFCGKSDFLTYVLPSLNSLFLIACR